MLQRGSVRGKKSMVKEPSGGGLGKGVWKGAFIETEEPEGAGRVPSWPHWGVQTATPTVTNHSLSPSPCHCRAYMLLILTGRLQQKLMPMVSNFYFGWPEINSVIELTLGWLLHSVVAPDTPVTSSNFRETLSSIHSSVEVEEHPLAPWISFSLSESESITKVFLSFGWSNLHIVWIRTIFWRMITLWDTSIYIAQTVTESICIKFTDKFFAQNFAVHHFWKLYVYNIPTRLEQKPNGAKCVW